MSKITNDGLTRSGTGCFIVISIWQQWASKGYFCTNSHCTITTNNMFPVGPMLDESSSVVCGSGVDDAELIEFLYEAGLSDLHKRVGSLDSPVSWNWYSVYRLLSCHRILQSDWSSYCHVRDVRHIYMSEQSLYGCSVPEQFGLSHQSGDVSLLPFLNELTVSRVRMCIGSWFQVWDLPERMHGCQSM